MAKLDRFIIDDTTYELVPEIAPLFNPATPYSVGDCVIHDAVLYKFTANHAAGAWTGNDVVAFEVGSELVRLGSGGSGSGLTEAVKVALLACFEKVAWIDEDGQDYYDALYDALYPPADVVSISAVFTQSGLVYDTDNLNSLKNNLVVTALLTNQTVQTVTNYVLSGTLTSGTSTITVIYAGKNATFNVTVTHDDSAEWDYVWRYTDGLPPASDWTWATSGGSNHTHGLVDDGMSITAKSGISARYYMPYAPSQILSAGGGAVECAFYIPTITSSNTTKVYYFSIRMSDGTNSMAIKLVHNNGDGSTQRVRLHNSTDWYSGTAIDTFNANQIYTIRLEMNCTNNTGAVYIDGVLKADDIDLSTISDANTEVAMFVFGSGIDSDLGTQVIIQSFKAKYGVEV